jgi:aspartate 1-decarboxylase
LCRSNSVTDRRRTIRSYLGSKIHRATVTHADLDYEGSLSIDAALLAAAGIDEFEEVHVWNVTRGTRLTPMRSQRLQGAM